MDDHVKNPKKLCRLCAKKVVTGRGYSHAKTAKEYNDVIMQLFHIQPNNENKEVSLVHLFFLYK